MAGLVSCSPLFINTDTPLTTLEPDGGVVREPWAGVGPGLWPGCLLSACFSKQLYLSVELLPVPPSFGPSSGYL